MSAKMYTVESFKRGLRTAKTRDGAIVDIQKIDTHVNAPIVGKRRDNYNDGANLYWYRNGFWQPIVSGRLHPIHTRHDIFEYNETD